MKSRYSLLVGVLLGLSLFAAHDAAANQQALEQELGQGSGTPPAPVPANSAKPEVIFQKAPVGSERDLAPESEPEWLKKGGNPENPPAYRLQGSGGGSAAAPDVSSQVKVNAEANAIEIATPFIFMPWSINLSDTDRAVLDYIAKLMQEKPDQLPKVRVEAYTDNSGDPAINTALSISRANMVMAYLIYKGVGVHRLEAAGLGDQNPIAPNDTKAGRVKNRRVEFKIVR